MNFVNADEAIKTVLSTEGNCKRTIRRKKNRMPLEPNNLDRLILSGTLIYDNEVNAASRIIRFATVDNLRLLVNVDMVISKW